MLELSTAQTEADFEDVYRFWYEVYVTEMGRHQNDAKTSHQNRKLYDPLATAGSLCIARQDGEVVGTILSTPVDHPAIENYRSLYDLDSLSPEDQWASAINTKLMVKANLRRTRLPVRLAFAAYTWGLHVGIKHAYMDCNDHLLKLFYRLGYEQHLPTLYHADYGQVNSMRLELTDETHLRKVGSPFLSALKRYQHEQELAPDEQSQKDRPQYKRPQPARSQRRQTTPAPAFSSQQQANQQEADQQQAAAAPAPAA